MSLTMLPLVNQEVNTDQFQCSVISGLRLKFTNLRSRGRSQLGLGSVLWTQSFRASVRFSRRFVLDQGSFQTNVRFRTRVVLELGSFHGFVLVIHIKGYITRIINKDNQGLRVINGINKWIQSCLGERSIVSIFCWQICVQYLWLVATFTQANYSICSNIYLVEVLNFVETFTKLNS